MNHSFQNDQRKAYHFREQAEYCLLLKDHEIKPSDPLIVHYSCEWWFGVFKNAASLFQLLATVGLASAEYILTQGAVAPR
jgi:hypothetical protein